MTSTLRVQLQLRIVSDDETMIRDEVILQLDKSGDRLEAIGLCLKDSKDLLGRLQHAVVEAQAAAYVNRHRCCSACGRRLRGKGQYPIVFRAHVHETDRHFHQSDHLRFNHSRHFARATAGPAPWGGARRWRLT